MSPLLYLGDLTEDVSGSPHRLQAWSEPSTGCRQTLGASQHPLPTLCPFLFQNKVVTVDGARVKLQVRAVPGRGEGLALCFST